jgi:hypothetical protein
VSARVLVVASLLGLSGCMHSSTPVGATCKAGAVQSCTCADGGSGAQSCLANGQDFGACDCSGLNGNGGIVSDEVLDGGFGEAGEL